MLMIQHNSWKHLTGIVLSDSCAKTMKTIKEKNSREAQNPKRLPGAVYIIPSRYANKNLKVMKRFSKLHFDLHT